MRHCLTINKLKLRLSIVLFLFSFFAQAQELSDQEIGFDVTHISQALKERGVREQDVQMQIVLERDMYTKMHLEVLQQQREIEKNIVPKENDIYSRVILATPEELAQDKAALIALYNSTNGVAWNNTTQGNGVWPVNDSNAVVTSYNPTTKTGWYGVTVGADGRVTVLNLHNNNLKGTIPSEISDLKNLRTLLLYINGLTGNIPSEISKLTSLGVLQISNNFLTGSIPTEIGNLIHLTDLRLEGNLLTGSIPSDITKLSKLSTLFLHSNKFSGEIPNLTTLPLRLFNFHVNKFRFVDFKDEFLTYKTNITASFSFSPQSLTDSPRTILRHAGQTVTMEMFEDLRFDSGDTYQWFKNGVALTGQTYRTLILPNLNTSHSGIYTCKAYHTANPDMSPLVLERHPITLTVDNATVTCTNYTPFFTTKGVDGQPYKCGTIKVISQLSNTDKIAEIKWTLGKPDGTQVLFSTEIIPNIEISQIGVHQIVARIVDINGCENYTAYSFEVFDCAVCEASILGEIVMSDFSPYTCGRRDFGLSFSNPDNLILNYEWRFYRANGDLWYTDNRSTLNTYFENYGTNRIELFIKNNRYECQTRTISIDVPVIECKNTCPIPGEIQILSECEIGSKVSQKLIGCDYQCGDRVAYLHFNSEQQVYDNSTYFWVIKDPNNNTIHTSTSSNYYIPFTFTQVGNNTVKLTITTVDGCPTVYGPITVPVVSCNVPCTPIIGEIKVNAPVVNPTPVTKDYGYQGIWLAEDTIHKPHINSWVDYIDATGVQKRFIVGARENGCQTITARSIVDTNGVGPCEIVPVGECKTYEINGGATGRTIEYVACEGSLVTLVVPRGDSIPVCSRRPIPGFIETGNCNDIVPE